MFKNEADFKKIIGRLNIDTEPNPAHRENLRRKMLPVFSQAKPQPTGRIMVFQIFRRTIMRNPVTKIAAAALIIAAILFMYSFSGSESVAFADVMQNIQNARTLTYQTVLTEVEQEPQVLKTMVLEPHLMRVELADGSIWITNHGQGKTLLLDSDTNQAVMSSTPQRTLYLYDTFQNFRNSPDFTVRNFGRDTINGTQAIGFRLSKENDENVIIVWADPQTSHPIRIEHTMKDKDGKVIKSMTTKIVFDAELDKSLFDLSVPDGYTHKSVDGPSERDAKLAQRTQAAKNMKKILLNCIMYAQEHQDQWPDNLQDLNVYGLAADDLMNPRHPEEETGYVYVKPEMPLSPSKVVLYEKYDSWTDGINVGFVDGHVEFITEESVFKSRLKESPTTK
jgi:prepilin-type processing-associated H-X9-DG protein